MVRSRVALAGLLCTASIAFGVAGPPERCAAAKLTAAGKAARSLLACHARAALTGAGADTPCLDAATTALVVNFSRAEAAGGCVAPGDAATIDAALRDLVAAVATTLRPNPTPSACAARKLLVVGKHANTVARAHARFQRNENAAARDAAINAASSALEAKFAHIDATGTCPVTGDGTAIANQVLGGLRTIVALFVPTCGDGIAAGDEACDGAQNPGGCAGCQSDCTCGSPVCGDGLVGGTEECEGTTCVDVGLGFAATCADCQCCDGGICQLLGCCHAGDLCLPTPGYPRGFCFQAACSATRPCSTGYTCALGPTGGICIAKVGSLCAYFGPLVPCEPPAICPAFAPAFCCLPGGSTCGAGGDCCSGTCAAGTCGS